MTPSEQEMTPEGVKRLRESIEAIEELEGSAHKAVPTSPSEQEGVRVAPRDEAWYLWRDTNVETMNRLNQEKLGERPSKQRYVYEAFIAGYDAAAKAERQKTYDSLQPARDEAAESEAAPTVEQRLAALEDLREDTFRWLEDLKEETDNLRQRVEILEADRHLSKGWGGMI